MNVLTYISTPLVCGVIGYFTNWIAIKMLFRPHRPLYIAGKHIPLTPGLIPKERERLSAQIAETLGSTLLTPEVLAQELLSDHIWDSIVHNPTLTERTVGALWARAGGSDPAAYIENALLTLLQEETVRQKLAALGASGVRSALTAVGDEQDHLWRQGVAGMTAFLAGETCTAWMDKGFSALQTRVFAEGVTPGDLLPAAWIDAVKKTAAEVLPHAVAYISRWPEDNPALEEKLALMVRKIIDENVGRLVGLFLDHQRIYTHIKEGLLTYLADTDNQQFMLGKINEAIDAFCATACTRWQAHCPDPPTLREKLQAWMQTEVGERVTGDTLAQLVGDWRPVMVLDRFIPDFDARLTAFLYERIREATQTALPKPLSHAVRALCREVQAWRVQEVMDYLRVHEKKAAIRHALKQIAAYIAEHMDIRNMVINKLNSFSVAESETIILSVVSRELRVITLLGGIFGFILGLVTILPRLFTS